MTPSNFLSWLEGYLANSGITHDRRAEIQAKINLCRMSLEEGPNKYDLSLWPKPSQPNPYMNTGDSNTTAGGDTFTPNTLT